MTGDPLVAVAEDKFKKGLAPDKLDAPAVYVQRELREALEATYSTDAHAVAYVVDGENPQRRVRKNGLALVGRPVTVGAFFVDLDNPEHGDWTEEARAAAREQEARLPILQTVGIYDTSHGRRLVQPLAAPIPAAEVEPYLRRYLKQLAAAGLQPDLTCKDWTRHFRLPNVQRDGRPFRSPYINLERMTPIALDPIHVEPPPPRATVEPPAARRVSSRSAVERARLYAAKVEPAVEGQNGDAATFRLCATVARGFDLTDDESLEALRDWNARCCPPWDEDELRGKVENARAYGEEPIGARLDQPPRNSTAGSREEPPPPGDDEAPAAGLNDELPHCTDTGNAKVFSMLARDRVCQVAGAWLTYDGARWKRDDTGAVMRVAREVAGFWYGRAGELLQRAQTAPDSTKLAEAAKALTAWGRQSESADKIKKLLKLSESELALIARVEDLDRDPWLLNCPNGTLDLRTGELRPHCREDRLTKVAGCDYDPAAPCPTWDRFLARVQPDPEVRAYLERLVGYWLTGAIREHVLPIHFGAGRNGKGVFHNSIMRALGEYARQVPTELLLSKTHDAHPTERAVLLGCRLAVASETDEGRSLNVALVKALTGGDRISARRMREDFFEFDPTHKLSLSTNHRPRIRETKEAIWERVTLIPWAVFIPPEERDLALEDKLKAELPGILAWAVRGCAEWQRVGLSPPQAVQAATTDYRGEEDSLAPFLADACVLLPHARVSSAALWQAYEAWCEANGERALGRRAFTERIAERGCEARKGTGGGRHWVGIGLLAQYPEAQVAHSGACSGMNEKMGSRIDENPEVAPPCATHATYADWVAGYP